MRPPDLNMDADTMEPALFLRVSYTRLTRITRIIYAPLLHLLVDSLEQPRRHKAAVPPAASDLFKEPELGGTE